MHIIPYVAHSDFLCELGFPQGRSRLRCDASSVIAITTSRASFRRSLYLARRATFLQTLGRDERVGVEKVDGEHNRADILTKMVSVKAFARLRHYILNVRQRMQVAAHSAVRALRYVVTTDM